MGEGRHRTEALGRLSRRSLAVIRDDVARTYPRRVHRPRTRGECVDGPRPCPWVSCRHHLALEVRGLRVVHRSATMGETCSLDIADRGEQLSLRTVGQLLGGLTRERARQLVVGALSSLRLALVALGE